MSVMLASPSKGFGSTPVDVIAALEMRGNWSFEMKWDGHRCIAEKQGGEVSLTSRSGQDATNTYPELLDELAAFHDGDFTLDGEVVAFNESGQPDFNLLARRKTANPVKARKLAQSIRAFYIVFDVLSLDEHDYRDTPYATRGGVLDLFDLNTPHLRRSVSTKEGMKLWDLVKERGLEGLVAKRDDSLYRPGRSDSWIKCRLTRSASFVVTGYEPGTGWAEGLVGALLLEAWDGEKLVPVGKVGTGFTAADRTNLLDLMHEHFIVDIEYQETTPDGLRFPSFRGVRDDITIQSCSLEQLSD